MRLRTVVAAATAAALLMPAPAVAAAPATVTRTFTASSADITNPGRGFFTYTETHFGDDYVPLDARTREGRSLVFRIFYLEKYQSVDTISAADLALIRADFAAARSAGVKLVVRFAYSAGSDADAPLARVLKHIAQLKPILMKNADLITAVQAGFIGRWGEWYYTRNLASDTSRSQVLNALLNATSPSTPVQVRTPDYQRRYAPAVARVGIHNDCFLAGTDDYGTYVNADDRTWLARQSGLVGGETCDVSDRSGWSNAAEEMAAYHWTYLNPSFNADVLSSWGADGLATASRRLGYRLRVVKTEMPARAAGTVTVKITLTNDGYAAPVQDRPVRLIVVAGRNRQSVPVVADVRTWRPGRSVTLTARFTMPKGSAQLYLSLPDPSPRLATNSAYAVQLANPGVWDAATGWNKIGALSR